MANDRISGQELAIALALRGMSYERIAAELNRERNDAQFDAKSVRDLLAGYLNRRPELSSQQKIELELERLDHLLVKISPDVDRGDLKAIELALKVSDRRCKLERWDSQEPLPEIRVEEPGQLDPALQRLIHQSLTGISQDFTKDGSPLRLK